MTLCFRSVSLPHPTCTLARRRRARVLHIYFTFGTARSGRLRMGSASQRLLVMALAAAAARYAVGDDLGDFQAWFVQRGGASPGNTVTLARFPGMGVGVQATGPIAAGDPVLTVPLETIM
jgi:hypothetical protein